MAKKILVTGSAGGVGRVVCGSLMQAGHAVRGLDRVATPDVESIVGDILDRDVVLQATAGMDTVIHLAATPDESDFLQQLLEPNVRGLFHVCDAARQQGVTRLILASSVQVAFGHDWSTKPVRVEDGARVINHYALTKLWAEDMGEMYARVYSMSVIAARLGWLPRSKQHAEELQASPFGTDVYLSHGDAGRFFLACVEADFAPTQFEALYATSRPAKQAKVDISATERIIGYRPQDRWPEGQPYLG